MTTQETLEGKVIFTRVSDTGNPSDDFDYQIGYDSFPSSDALLYNYKGKKVRITITIEELDDESEDDADSDDDGEDTDCDEEDY